MLYIITDGTNYKLGYSINPASRLKELQTANAKPLVLLGTAEGEIEDERRYHKLLAETRLVGEWFSPSYELFGILQNWVVNAPVSLPDLKTGKFCSLFYKKQPIHYQYNDSAPWFSVKDVAKISKLSTNSLTRRKAINSKLLLCENVNRMSTFIDTDSMLLIFRNDSELVTKIINLC